MGEFTGKVAIVTGGGRGIGRATALLLAREGASVVVNDLGGGPSGDGEDVSVAQKVVDEISAAGGEALADGSDISRWDSVEALIAKTVDRFGQLDILVASAGIIRIGRVDEIDEDDFDRLMAVNLKGVFAAIRFAAPHLIKRGGSIVAFGSPSGLGHYANSCYGAAKEGILGLTRSVARDLGPFGVRCNALRPIAAESALGTQDAIDSMLYATQTLGIPAAGNQVFAPLGGIEGPCGPEHVAAVVGWLCTDHAASINGRELYIAGDHVALLQESELIRSQFHPGGWDFASLCSAPVSAALTYDQCNRFSGPS